jgi:hypothetical protein
MSAASFIAVFLIPACFYVVEKLGGHKPAPAADAAAGAKPAGEAAH